MTGDEIAASEGEAVRGFAEYEGYGVCHFGTGDGADGAEVGGFPAEQEETGFGEGEAFFSAGFFVGGEAFAGAGSGRRVCRDFR